MIFETETALRRAMQDENVTRCDWLHPSGPKLFKLDLTEVLETKKRLSDDNRSLVEGRKLTDYNIILNKIQQEKRKNNDYH